jgi:outer membrane biosynthesis protein TonB
VQSSAAQTALRDQRQTRAPQLGSFSLDTYEWNFAPYMLWLKQRVQGNIYPPPAFTHMGLISGQTLLRFKIHRDGSLRDLELLNYRGHKSLMETSMRAIELSVPLQKLPPDFPKDYLEVTAQFDYTILNSSRADEP